jgi:membrane protease YdiL (CAAX protease family)
MSDDQTALLETSLSAQNSRSIAPAWHTVGVLLLLFALIASSTRLHSVSRAGHNIHRMHGYIFMLTAEWLITAFIWFGCRLQGVSLRTLTGVMSPNWRAVLRDLGLAIAFLIVANMVVSVLGHLTRATPNQSALRNLLPRGGAEIAVFLLLSLTGGLCEEVIYRGYLQQQFTAWTKSATAGIMIQGILFGVSHAYQGSGMILMISVTGCLFGLLASWRRSLRPGMIAHFLQDGVGGLLLAKYALK